MIIGKLDFSTCLWGRHKKIGIICVCSLFSEEIRIVISSHSIFRRKVNFQRFENGWEYNGLIAVLTQINAVAMLLLVSRKILRFIVPKSCLAKPTFSRKMEYNHGENQPFQCIGNGSQNEPFPPGSFQDTFIICSVISQQHIFELSLKKHFDSPKSENLQIRQNLIS